MSNMAKGMLGAWLTLAFLYVPTTESQVQPPVRDLSYFLRRLRTVDHMPELEASHTAMSSTWDRSGGNDDGTNFKNIVRPTAGETGRNILLDVAGPGCIHRIFVGMLTEQQAGTRIQIFLDHSPKPLFDMPILEFFSDSHGRFPYPLSFHKSYPGTLFPIPLGRTASSSWLMSGSASRIGRTRRGATTGRSPTPDTRIPYRSKAWLGR